MAAAPIMDSGRSGAAYGGRNGLPATMQCAYYHTTGDNSVLQTPEALPRTVIVRVHAAALNPVDYKCRSGGPATFFFGKPTAAKPIVPGFDVAGTIVARGSNVPAEWAIGTKVFCMGNEMGACAEYVRVLHTTLARKPASLTFAQAASIPLAGLTADQALTRAEVGSGHKVVITAGSGGVGSLAIQLAKARGAFVATTCSPRNEEFVVSLGADLTVNYRAVSLEKALKGGHYDAGVDCTNEVNKILRVVRPGAHVSSILAIPSYGNLVRVTESYNKPLNCCLLCTVGCFGDLISLCCRPGTCCCCGGGRVVEGVLTTPDGDNLARLASLLDAGRIRPVIDKVFPLAQTPDAMAYIETGKARGKVVVQVIPETSGGVDAATSPTSGADAGAGAGAGAGTAATADPDSTAVASTRI